MSPEHKPRWPELRIDQTIPMNEQATPSFGISSGVVLAATYIVLGKLGLMLAIQPGYASGIFPPAGLAIAATYLWGSPTLPWIVLGSFTLNFSVSTAPTDFIRYGSLLYRLGLCPTGMDRASCVTSNYRTSNGS